MKQNQTNQQNMQAFWLMFKKVEGCSFKYIYLHSFVYKIDVRQYSPL